MLRFLVVGLLSLLIIPVFSQTSRIVVIGSSTAAGEGSSPRDSSWVSRLNQTYKRASGQVDTIYNLGVSGLTLYEGLPDSFRPSGRPLPDGQHNVSKAVSLLRDLPVPARGIILVNFPTNGYNTYSIAEVMSGLQLIYDSATRFGNRCYITTTQPRFDTDFNNAATKRKLAALKDSILNRFGTQSLNFWDPVVNNADTSILSNYSAGDGVHLNNAGHRMLYNVVAAKNIFTNVILPLVWGELSVSPKETDIEITWSTLQENNTASFIIEVSTDGIHYTEFARVAATGKTSGTNTYHYTHHNVKENQLQYYRIRQSDKDGKATYSEVKSIRLAPTGKLALLMENPVRQFARLKVFRPSEASLLDFSGRMLLHIKLSIGNQSVSLGAYPAGQYQLQVHANGNTQTLSIIKL